METSDTKMEVEDKKENEIIKIFFTFLSSFLFGIFFVQFFRTEGFAMTSLRYGFWVDGLFGIFYLSAILTIFLLINFLILRFTKNAYRFLLVLSIFIITFITLYLTLTIKEGFLGDHGLRLGVELIGPLFPALYFTCFIFTLLPLFVIKRLKKLWMYTFIFSFFLFITSLFNLKDKFQNEFKHQIIADRDQRCIQIYSGIVQTENQIERGHNQELKNDISRMIKDLSKYCMEFNPNIYISAQDQETVNNLIKNQ